MDLLRRLFGSGGGGAAGSKGGKAPKWTKETVNQEVLNARYVSEPVYASRACFLSH
jgi:hypothetical protein